MWVLVIIFAAVGLWFFPVAVAVSYKGRWRLFWLPRVWCGFAAPRELPLIKEEREGESLLHRLPRRFSFILTRQLISRIRLMRLRFYLAPGCSRLVCIAGITVGNIIISIERAAAVYRRRLKRRGQWPLSMISRN